MYRNQLIGIAAYNAAFCMGNKDNKKPKDLFPELFDIDDDDDIPAPEITEDDVKEMQELMKNYPWQ